MNKTKKAVRKTIRWGMLSLCAVLVTGCAFELPFDRSPAGEEADFSISGDRSAGHSGGSAHAEDLNGSQPGQVTPQGANVPEPYYYASLDDAQLRSVYERILQSMTEMGTDAVIGCQDEEVLDRVFKCVLADHPELFYVTGYTYTKYTQDSEVLEISFCGTYSMTEEKVRQCQTGIDKYVEKCLSGMPQGDDYAKIRYLYEYIIRGTEYSLEAPENQNICSVFLYGQSVCQGYAKAFQYLCSQAGIAATIVTGRIRDSGYGHAWNLVKADGDYYYVDVTWGDASYTVSGNQSYPSVSYEYLCVTTEQIDRTHVIETTVGMPQCVSIEDNFYVRENAFFTEFDKGRLELLFAGNEGEYVTFQCQSEEIYRQYDEYLIGQERIFDYMDSPYGISYCDNEETLTFGFWTPQN